MKTKLLFTTVLVCGAFVFASCSDDDNYVPENNVVSTFGNKYPNAQRVEWENKSGYKVADFYLDSKEMEAWFDYDGKWIMTETDLLFKDLPQVIQTSFTESLYASWRVDDVDKLERENTATVYIIEVEQKGSPDMDLYYSEDGTLIKAVADEENLAHQPLVIPEAIINKIKSLYPQAQFLEFEKKGTFIEIDIIDGKVHKEVLFNSNNEWISTEWDIRTSDVPTNVMNALKASEYKDYRIDDVEVLEKPEGLFYVFELESGKTEIYLTISAEGIIVVGSQQ